MFRYEVQSRLEELARQPDDWFGLRDNGDGTFAVRDATGAGADIVVGEQWVDVIARRPLDLSGRAISVGAGMLTLVRVGIGGTGTPFLETEGRVYLDGFSMHRLFLTVRDVLALAGPEPMSATTAVSASAGAFEPAVIEAESEESADLDAAPPLEGQLDTRADVADAVEPAESAVLIPPDVARVDVGEEPLAADDDRPIAEGRVVPEHTAEAVAEPPAAQAAVEAPAEPIVADEPPPRPAPVGAPAGEPAQTSDAIAPPSAPERMVPATMRIPRQQLGIPIPEAAPATPAGGVGVTLDCRRCGAPVEGGERFCINCGAPQSPSLAQPAAAPPSTARRSSEPDTVVWRRPPAGSVLCPRCGETNASENRHCQACGLALSGEGGVTEAAGVTPDAAGAIACARCGFSNPSGNRFCQGCGAPLAD